MFVHVFHPMLTFLPEKKGFWDFMVQLSMFELLKHYSNIEILVNKYFSIWDIDTCSSTEFRVWFHCTLFVMCC